MREISSRPNLLTPMPSLFRRYATAIPIGIALWLVLRLIERIADSAAVVPPSLPSHDGRPEETLPLVANILISVTIFLSSAAVVAGMLKAGMRHSGRLLMLISDIFRKAH